MTKTISERQVDNIDRWCDYLGQRDWRHSTEERVANLVEAACDETFDEVKKHIFREMSESIAKGKLDPKAALVVRGILNMIHVPDLSPKLKLMAQTRPLKAHGSKPLYGGLSETSTKSIHVAV